MKRKKPWRFLWKGGKKANWSQYVKRWNFSSALLFSLWPFLCLWHLHSPCCILLTPPLLWKNPSFPELLHILPSSLFPPEWSHWLPMPPSALNWLGTDPKIPPSQQLLWAKRSCPLPLQLCPGGDSYPQGTKYECWAHAWHSPNTHSKLQGVWTPLTSKECRHLYSGRLFLCLLLLVFALFLNHFKKFPLCITIENLGKPEKNVDSEQGNLISLQNLFRLSWL